MSKQQKYHHWQNKLQQSGDMRDLCSSNGNTLTTALVGSRKTSPGSRACCFQPAWTQPSCNPKLANVHHITPNSPTCIPLPPHVVPSLAAKRDWTCFQRQAKSNTIQAFHQALTCLQGNALPPPWKTGAYLSDKRAGMPL